MTWLSHLIDPQWSSLPSVLVMMAAPPPEGDGGPAWDDLIEATLKGDQDAGNTLLRRVLPRVRNLVRYLIRGDEMVDDIAQEALINVVRGLKGYRREGRFESWVDRIVSRTTFEQIRRDRKRPDAPGPLDAQVVPLPAGTETAETYVARRQQVALLDRLSQPQREALVLHHAVGMELGEIAEMLEISAETVKSRLRLARAKLREIDNKSVHRPTDLQRLSPSKGGVR